MRSGGTIGFNKMDVLRIEKTAPLKKEEAHMPGRLSEREPEKEKEGRPGGTPSTRPDDYMARAMEIGERGKEVLKVIRDIDPSQRDKLEQIGREIEILKREVNELKENPPELSSKDPLITEEIQDSLGKVSDALDIGHSTIEGEDRTQLDKGINLIDEAQSQMNRSRERIKE